MREFNIFNQILLSLFYEFNVFHDMISFEIFDFEYRQGAKL